MFAKIKSFFFPAKLLLLEVCTKYWIKKYLKNTSIKKKKLQFGCGSTRLRGWLNSDLSGREFFARRNLFIDVAKPLPIADNSFDFLYAEHLIEHLSYETGQNFLKECYRVLKPEGVLRLAFPSLEFICSFYLSKEAWAESFFKFWSDPKTLENYGTSHGKNLASSKAGIVNLFFSEWGHKILYDMELIKRSLHAAGFEFVMQHPNGSSNFPELCNIETRVFSRQYNVTATPYTVEAIKKKH